MPLVKAPNGAEMELDDAVASGLVNSKDSGWSYVEEKAPAKRAQSQSDKK